MLPAIVMMERRGRGDAWGGRGGGGQGSRKAPRFQFWLWPVCISSSQWQTTHKGQHGESYERHRLSAVTFDGNKQMWRKQKRVAEGEVKANRIADCKACLENCQQHCGDALATQSQCRRPTSGSFEEGAVAFRYLPCFQLLSPQGGSYRRIILRPQPLLSQSACCSGQDLLSSAWTL